MRRYKVKEVFGPTLQGEGRHAGRSCVFLRLAGCNAWDGRPATRASSACPYCDTDFLGGEELELEHILQRLEALAAACRQRPGCVLSGGEPLLQADAELLAALGAAFPWVDIETNGSRPCPPRPPNVHVSCSPKDLSGRPLAIGLPDWWKVLLPAQARFLPAALASGRPVYVQPVCPDGGPHGPAYEAALAACLQACHDHGCILSLQIHKIIGIA